MSIGLATKGILGKIMGDITTVYRIVYPLSIDLSRKKKQIDIRPIRKPIALIIKRD